METQIRNAEGYRHLSSSEREQLKANGNRAEDWDSILVAEPFFPGLIQNSSFGGEVRIQSIRPQKRVNLGKVLSTGIYNSEIRNCRIGEQAVIRNVAYCADYRIGNDCILSDIQELYTGPGAKFGCGVVHPGEEESTRHRIALINEAGDRRVPAFPGMTAGDALLWARFREDSGLMRRLEEITDADFGGISSSGELGSAVIIQGCGSLRNLRIGPSCRIEGAAALEELTIASSPDEPVVIGANTILRRGVIGTGCRICDGAIAEDFILASHVSLTRGVRLSESFVGDNAAIACCEVSNCLIYPFHEQHHNNSFLIASLVMGQSNIAAGATIGSNHNSRSADNELSASRGFWPGLNVSLKHPSGFASFTLISKGTYPAELDIPLPFSLVSNNEHEACLELIPAFWWNYNMYALVRNARKYAARDKRRQLCQQIELDFLAPDTAAEIRSALELLDQWDPSGEAEVIEAPRGQLERSSRIVRILKAARARQAYREMLTCYIAMTLLPALEEKGAGLIDKLSDDPRAEAPLRWTNLGGQLVPESKVDLLREDIRRGTLSDWEAIHRRYTEWNTDYAEEKRCDAYAHFCLLEGNKPDAAGWQKLFAQAERIQRKIAEQVYQSRNKDLQDPFKARFFRNEAEKTKVLGSMEDNELIRQIREESLTIIKRLAAVRKILQQE